MVHLEQSSHNLGLTGILGETIGFKDGSIIAHGPTEEILSDMSLLQQGVNLPQVAIMCSRLQEKGLPLEKIAVTDKEAVRVIEKALKERK